MCMWRTSRDACAACGGRYIETLASLHHNTNSCSQSLAVLINALALKHSALAFWTGTNRLRWHIDFTKSFKHTLKSFLALIHFLHPLFTHLLSVNNCPHFLQKSKGLVVLGSSCPLSGLLGIFIRFYPKRFKPTLKTDIICIFLVVLELKTIYLK